MDDKKVLATVTKTNVYGLAIYEVTSDEVLVGVNGEEPSWVEIQYDDQGEPYIDCYGETYLSEFIKSNIGGE